MWLPTGMRVRARFYTSVPVCREHTGPQGEPCTDTALQECQPRARHWDNASTCPILTSILHVRKPTPGACPRPHSLSLGAGGQTRALMVIQWTQGIHPRNPMVTLRKNKRESEPLGSSAQTIIKLHYCKVLNQRQPLLEAFPTPGRRGHATEAGGC